MAAAVGYSPCNPYTTLYGVYSGPTRDWFEFGALPDAIRLAVRQDSSLVLWKTYTAVQPSDADVDIMLGHDLPREDSPFHTIGIIIDHVHFRQTEIDRAAVAGDMHKIFVDLCKTLAPVYGYATDENGIEQFWTQVQRLGESVARREKPSVLFWLNYFAAAYADQIGRNALERLPGRLASLDAGISLSLWEHPWDVDYMRLARLNAQWQQAGAQLR